MKKFFDIDPWNIPIEELKEIVAKLEDMVDFYESKQLANKKFINSVYGACASKYFIASDTRVALAITTQGRDLNHFSENCVNAYFSGPFQQDVELHKKLGVDHEVAKNVVLGEGKGAITKRYPNVGEDFDYLKTKWSATVAGDTDSIYVEFGPFLEQMHIPTDKQAEAVVTIWEESCQKFLNKAYEKYAEHYHTKTNKQNLELEKIAATTILVAKKRYSMSIAWGEPNIFFNIKDNEHVIYKGLELIQGSTPKFVKTCMDDFFKYLLKWYYNHNETPPYDQIINKLKEYKSKFRVQSPDDICKATSISDYRKYVVDDKNEMVYKNGTPPIHVRAAATYNNVLYNSKYKGKYSPITSGKVKWYYVDGKEDEVFAFSPRNFPAEIAPKINYDEHFKKLLLEPLNRIITAIGLQAVSPSLAWEMPLF